MPDDSSGSGQTVKSTSTPWAPQQPYLTGALAAAKTLYDKGAPSYYPFSTVAPVAPETQSGWSATTARATNGSPVNAAAQGYNTDVLHGNYLNAGNPYLGAVDTAMWNQVNPRTASTFEGAGRYGPNAAYGNAVGSAYTDAIAPYHYGAYASERSAQDAAAGRAPALANQDYVDTQALGQVGAQRTAQAQTEIDAAQQRYAYDSQAPSNWLSQYIQQIQGNYGGTKKENTSVASTPWWQSLLNAGAGAAGSALPLAFGA